MFSLNPKNIRHLRLLICLPLLVGLWPFLAPSSHLHIDEAWPDGPVTITINQPESSNDEKAKISEHHEISANHVILNEATHRQLLACPGIGSKTANLILKERSFARFFDWRDLQTRVKGLGNTTIERLQDAGVRLNADDSP